MFVNWSVAKYDDPNIMNLPISFNCNYYFILNILIEYLLVNIYETNYEYDDKSTVRSPVAIYWKLNVGTKGFWLRISGNSCLFNICKFVFLWMAYIERKCSTLIHVNYHIIMSPEYRNYFVLLYENNLYVRTTYFNNIRIRTRGLIQLKFPVM